MTTVCEILEERSSKGFVKEFTEIAAGMGVNSKKAYKDSPFYEKVLMDMVEADPTLFGAVSLTADLVTYNGYSFLGEDAEKAKEMFDNKFDFDQVVENLLFQLLVYGNAYLELRWNTTHSKIIELHPLESTEIRLQYNKHGDIAYALQKLANKGQEKWPKFKPDEFVFFRMHWVGSSVYSKNPFQSIQRVFSTKIYSDSYLSSLFTNVPPKIIYFLKNAGKDQRKVFMQDVLLSKVNPGMDIFANGEGFDAKFIEPNFSESLIKIRDSLRKEYLALLRVPPHWIGMMDGANRGIGENVVIPYETKIKKLQHKIASQINREILPKLGLKAEFQFNAISLLDEKSIVEIMNMLAQQGFDGETIIEYGRKHGLKFRKDAKIEKPDPTNGLQNDAAPSRIGMNKKTDGIKNKLNKKGVSVEGGKKLAKKKVM